MKLLVTGSGGLIGSEAVSYFASKMSQVFGFDNNMRQDFFGPGGDVSARVQSLKQTFPNYQHRSIDIRDERAVFAFFREEKPDFILHAAAQPSHDLAASRPIDDFDTNARATLLLLEAVRQYCPKAVFVFMSTNKVYGDRPNYLPIVELESRWEYAGAERGIGIGESMSIDNSLHSLFGVSKTAADLAVQEYGKYFGLYTTCLRAGCLTGPHHAGVELHGFLSYLTKCIVTGKPYTVFGYGGKQVRDNIHSYDICSAIEQIFSKPSVGEVFNIGGGHEQSCSILEAVRQIEKFSGKKAGLETTDQARKGDHICYYSDMRKFHSAYPHWTITKDLTTTISEIVAAVSLSSSN